MSPRCGGWSVYACSSTRMRSLAWMVGSIESPLIPYTRRPSVLSFFFAKTRSSSAAAASARLISELVELLRQLALVSAGGIERRLERFDHAARAVEERLH